MAVATLTRRRSDRTGSSPLEHVDWALVMILGALSVMSVVVVLAATHGPRTTTNDTYFMVRQGAFIALGWGVFAAVTAFDYRKLAEWWGAVYGVAVLSLLAVLVFAPVTRGARLGIQVGGIMIQTSEFVKVAVIVALAGYLAIDPADRTWRRTLSAIGLVALPVLLILLQPDLGTALVFGAIALATLLVAGVPAKHMAVLTLVAVVGAGIVVNSPVLEEYQRERLTHFLNPDSPEPSRTRYNTEQSEIAIASGGLTGQGLMKGGQTSNGFVPAQETDFIFTAVGEELGFVGSSALLALYSALLWRVLRTAQLSRDHFGTLICSGVFGAILFQVFENVGMTMGIMPMTGIPLPFMSYGGSSILAMFAMAGLVMNVHMRRFS